MVIDLLLLCDLDLAQQNQRASQQFKESSRDHQKNKNKISCKHFSKKMQQPPLENLLLSIFLRRSIENVH
jgi:hypothetical protein